MPDGRRRNDICPEPNPTRSSGCSACETSRPTWAACGVTVGGAGVVTAVSLNEHDYWPNTLYDAREAQTRDATPVASTDIALAGVMHYVELDVNNLRRWLAGQFAGVGAPNGVNAKNENGYIVYFSDRRGKNIGAPALQQGEFGYEDNVNPATSAGTPNGQLDTGEDANGNGALEPLWADCAQRAVRSHDSLSSRDIRIRYMAQLRHAILTNASLGVGAAVGANCAGAGQVATATPDRGQAARRTRQPSVVLPPRSERSSTAALGKKLADIGLTIASENPVYVQGNYNAQADNTLADPHVPAAIVADAVTLLSNGWNDIRSFVNPANPGDTSRDDDGLSRGDRRWQ